MTRAQAVVKVRSPLRAGEGNVPPALTPALRAGGGTPQKPKSNATSSSSACKPPVTISPITYFYLDRRPRTGSVCVGGVRWG